jgi:hypothetical protein
VPDAALQRGRKDVDLAPVNEQQGTVVSARGG